MNIAVVGAAGRLGAEIVRTLVRNGVDTTAIASRRLPEWTDEIHCVHFETRSAPSALVPLFEKMDALIVAAPLLSAELHRSAVRSGCHVADVGVNPTVIAEMIGCDGTALEQGRSMIAMAGLSPGATGLIGLDLSARFPESKRVEICLLQSADGTAGDRGVRDMLDLLTDSSTRCGSYALHIPGRAAPERRMLFAFPSCETIVIDDEGRMTFATAFQGEALNALVRLLALLRRTSRRSYEFVRNSIAKKKAASTAKNEDVILSAVGFDQGGRAIAHRSLRFVSDYGATAAAATAAAMMAVEGRLPSGAGHISRFLTLDRLLEHPAVVSTLLESSQPTAVPSRDDIPEKGKRG